MPDNYPDPTTPFVSEGDVIRHLSSPYYASDSYFRDCCEKKLALGVPGATTLQASELSGKHSAIPEGLVEQAAAEEATQQQHYDGLTIGGVARFTFAPGATAQAQGEAAQRAREANNQQQE